MYELQKHANFYFCFTLPLVWDPLFWRYKVSATRCSRGMYFPVSHRAWRLCLRLGTAPLSQAGTTPTPQPPPAPSLRKAPGCTSASKSVGHCYFSESHAMICLLPIHSAGKECPCKCYYTSILFLDIPPFAKIGGKIWFPVICTWITIKNSLQIVHLIRKQICTLDTEWEAFCSEHTQWLKRPEYLKCSWIYRKI